MAGYGYGDVDCTGMRSNSGLQILARFGNHYTNKVLAEVLVELGARTVGRQSNVEEAAFTRLIMTLVLCLWVLRAEVCFGLTGGWLGKCLLNSDDGVSRVLENLPTRSLVNGFMSLIPY